MANKKNQKIEIPEEFESYEEAAEFWDKHDTTDFENNFESVEFETKLENRRYEIEIDADLIPILNRKAKKNGVAVKTIVSNLLRKELV